MSIKGVLFDLEGTLVERSLNDPEVFHKVLEWKGLQIQIEEIEKAVSKVKMELGDMIEGQCGKIPRLDYHNLWNLNILKVLGVEDHDRSILREVSDQWIDICGLTLQHDAKFTLTNLKANGLKTGIVSGAYEEEVQRILEIVELDEAFFDVLVGSDTIKRKKPAPEVFRYALNQLKIKPEESLYVGNDLKRDYRAAERAGIIPFLFLKSDEILPCDIRKIKNLISLMDYID